VLQPQIVPPQTLLAKRGLRTFLMFGKMNRAARRQTTANQISSTMPVWWNW
ncbi:uncharacterized protein METZ01_LOCUS115986, partial [marine metagenome]